MQKAEPVLDPGTDRQPPGASKRGRIGTILIAVVALSAAYTAWRVDFTPRLTAQPAGPRTDLPPPQPSRPLAAVAEGANAFGVISDVSENAVQSVVNISTTRIVRQQMSPDEQFFRRFFGGRVPESDRNMRENSLGSGVIVSQDGIVLTNNHVIDKASEIRVKLSDGRDFAAKLVGADPRSDVAVLRLEGKPTGLRALPLADSDHLRLGEVVLAIGSPFGLAQTVTMGIVSAKGRADVHIADYEDFIQTDAAINPGNSGGGLVNLRGELVGINTAIASSTGGSQGVGFAIPSNMARSIMASLLKTGKVTRGWLGVGIQDLNGELRKEFAPGLGNGGVLVTDVQSGSPAEKSGLRRGDVIVKLGDAPMDSPRRLRNLIGMHVPGTKLPVDLLRDGKPQRLEVMLGDAPDADLKAVKSGGLDGLTIEPLDVEARRKFQIPPVVPGGVVVTEIAKDSPAAMSGLQPGDVILEVNRRPLRSVSDFQAVLKLAKGQLLLLVFRDGHAFYLALR